ncbi:nonstructural protein [Blackfly microvirus SF02]|uniref:Nonstructural protein n=1 Tax=Blackfly microvirus SF02 TaxID=2576452 RepID=A0A4V1F5F3_9VIRU|nr:nonstructural protein [Blackfly microvirus SF02]
MKMQVFSIFDKAVSAYLPPFYTRSKGEAVRSFSEAANDPSSQFNKHMLDYSLMFMGEWDDNSGEFTGVQPVRVLSAHEVIEEKSEDVLSPLSRAPRQVM